MGGVSHRLVKRVIQARNLTTSSFPRRRESRPGSQASRINQTKHDNFVGWATCCPRVVPITHFRMRTFEVWIPAFAGMTAERKFLGAASQTMLWWDTKLHLNQ